MLTGLDDQLVQTEPEQVGMSPSGLANVSRLVRRYVDEQRYPGVLSLVARHDRVVLAEVYGEMDTERHQPVQLDTIFRIYSMTKPIASVGLMMLYEQGRFKLNDPVSQYLPELADVQVFAGGTADNYDVRPPARAMTVRDLLMHTSGLVGLGASTPVGELYRRAEVGDAASDGTLADTVSKLARLPLQVDPGARWIYGMSTDLVGRLCEVLSGQPFDQYLQARILEPLGMHDTAFSVPEGNLDRFAAMYGRTAGTPGYELIDDPLTSCYTRPRSYLSGASGLVSTAGDYLRFCRMLCRGGELDGERILGSRTLAFMTANQLPGGQDLETMAQNGGETHREGQGFGLGFGVLLDPVAAQTLGTAGEYFWGGAASTTFFVNPAEDLIMIFLTQLRPSLSYPIRRELRATVYASITG